MNLLGVPSAVALTPAVPPAGVADFQVLLRPLVRRQDAEVRLHSLLVLELPRAVNTPARGEEDALLLDFNAKLREHPLQAPLFIRDRIVDQALTRREERIAAGCSDFAQSHASLHCS